MKALTRTLAVLSLSLLATAYYVLAPTIVRSTTAVTLAVTDGKEKAIIIPENISNEQLRLLALAYDIAKEDGYVKPQWLQGIIMQETNAGGIKAWRVAGLQNKEGDRYFGLGQIKLAAAQAVMAKYPDMWNYLNTKTNEELQARLVLDDEFNLRVASKYAIMMGINNNPTFALTAYNQGMGGAQTINPETWHYTVGVKQHVAKLGKNVQQGENKLQSMDKLTVALR